MFKFLKLDQFKETSFLTGLRAYAALAVFFIHSQGQWWSEGGLRTIDYGSDLITKSVNAIIDFGKYGVIIFFVLSAYTIAISLSQYEKINYGQFLWRRFLRVLPIYYIIIVIAFACGGISDYFVMFNTTNSWWNLVSHLTFLNLFEIENRNNLLGVEWSIPIELCFYLVLPPAFYLMKKNINYAFYILILSLCIVYMGPRFISFDDSQFKYLAYQWSLTKYVFCFAFGLVLYYFQKIFKNQIPHFSSLTLASLGLLLFCYILSGRQGHEEFMTVWTGALILALHSRSKLSRLMFENKIVLLLGTISYSFYLIHFPVMYFLRQFQLNSLIGVVAAFLATTLLSILTYALVEKPFVDLGRKYFSKK